MFDICRSDFSLLESRHHDVAATTSRDPSSKIVIGIEEDRTFRRNALRQDRFLLSNRLPSPEKLDMRDSHIRDDGVLRRGNIDQARDFTRMVHTVLENRNLVLTLKSQ